VFDIDIAALRAVTPGCAHRVHLNNAGAALLTEPTIATMTGYLDLEAGLAATRPRRRAPKTSMPRTKRSPNSSAARQSTSRCSTIRPTHGTRPWIGHNGDIPGLATVSVYLPDRDATLIVFTNSDIPEPHAAGQLATDVTSIATPDHVYRLGPQPPLREPRR
jgi:hypothetical protein